MVTIVLFLTTEKTMEKLKTIPTVAMNSLMMSKVSSTILSFLMVYSLTFISYSLVFHILLPESQSFKTLPDSFIKVFAMLLGEYDFTANFINSTWIAKICFILFLYKMSLALMNLVLGLAVSDISALEKTSRIQRTVLETYATLTFEHVLNLFR